jgi:protein disulfide-isomerase A6
MASWAREEVLKTAPVKFTQLINQEVYNEYCKDYFGACVIAFLPHIYDTTAEERNQYLAILEEVKKKYFRNDKNNF